MRTVLKGRRTLGVRSVVLEDGTEVPVDMKLLAFIPRRVDRESYVKVYQDYILDAVVNNKLTKAGLKVLMWFMSQTTWSNDWIVVDYKELGEEVGLKERTVKQAIKQLLDANLLIQYRRGQTVFRLNPRYIYKGGVVGKREDIDF